MRERGGSEYKSCPPVQLLTCMVPFPFHSAYLPVPPPTPTLLSLFLTSPHPSGVPLLPNTVPYTHIHLRQNAKRADRLCLFVSGNSVALHPNQAELISVDQSGTVRTWDLVGNREQHPKTARRRIPLQSVSIATDASAAWQQAMRVVVFWKPGSLQESSLL